MITERGGLPLVGFYFGSFDAVHWVATSHSVSIEQVIEQARQCRKLSANSRAG